MDAVIMGRRLPWLRYHAIIISIRSDTQSSIINFICAASFRWAAWPSVRRLFLWNARLLLMKLLWKKPRQRQCVEAMAMVLLSKVGRSDETLWNFFAIARGFSKCGRTGGETYRSRWASEISRRHSLKSPISTSVRPWCSSFGAFSAWCPAVQSCPERMSKSLLLSSLFFFTNGYRYDRKWETHDSCRGYLVPG